MTQQWGDPIKGTREFIGLDLGSGDRTIVTTFTNSHLRVGDRITRSGESNRVRCRVVKVHSATSAELATFYRPSRGYARHVRRRKATNAKR